MEQYSSIQQLLKKEDGHKGRKPIYPPTVIQAAFDGKTGASLEAILAQFNSVYVQYQGTAKDTRLIIPKEMRRAGLTITYMDMDSNTITERANSAVQKDNDHWGLDVNWSRVDELSLSGDISVSAKGTWIINGKDTGVKALGPKGDTGLTPWLKTIDNKLHFSYDNVTWEPCSDYIAAWFRWNDNKIQVSRDNKTWIDLSGKFADNVYIKGYVATTSALPSGAAQGDVYGVGPTYAAEDTAHTNPIYRYYVRNANSWVDNGSFTSLSAGVVQETGDSETEVMSQKAVTEELSKLELNETNIIYTIFRNYLVFGVLQENGNVNLNYSGWYSYNKIPMKKGDNVTLSFGFIPSISEIANFVVFDSDNNIIHAENSKNINYTFANDGYLSFSFYESATNNINIRNSTIFPGIDKNFQEIKDLTFEVKVPKNISEYITNGYLKADGTIVITSGWKTYNKIPVSVGDSFIASFGLVVSLDDTAQVIIYDSDSQIIKTLKGSNVNYQFTQQGFISFCYYTGRENNFVVNTLSPLREVINQTKNIKWCAIGDSITAGNTANTGTSYATFAADMIGSQIELQKLGYWGHTMKETLYPTAFNLIDDDTDIVTINFGSNDIFVLGEKQWGDIDEIIAKNSDELVANQSTFESLRLFLEKMREQHPSVLIYIINPIKRSYNGGIQERFNEREKKICSYYSIPVLDAFNESGIRYDDVIYKADGVHPSDAGKLVFGRWLVSKLSFLNL